MLFKRGARAYESFDLVLNKSNNFHEREKERERITEQGKMFFLWISLFVCLYSAHLFHFFRPIPDDDSSVL